MICPICHKNQANSKVIKNFGSMTVEGLVCEDCYNMACSLDAKGFYYLFYELPKKSCSVCGRSYREFSETLLLGCPNCYNEFRAELEPLISRVQGGGNK